MLTVNIRERDGGERRLVFGTEEVTIGRAKGSDILLPATTSQAPRTPGRQG